MTPKKFWSWFVLAWFVTGIPLFLLHGVPGVDTPNHVARLHVLASLREGNGLSSFYQSHWAILPNLAVDLFITPIVYFFNVNALALMKVFLFNSMGVTGAGFALTNRAITGRWSAWGLFGLLFSYSYVLGFGFINYLFGIGLSLLFIGVQLLLKERKKLRMIVVAVGFPVLLLNHLLALALGAMALILIAIWQRDKCRQLWIGFGIGSFLSLIYMKLAATVGVGRASIWYDAWPEHYRNVFFPLYFSNAVRDTIFWFALIGIVAWLIVKHRRSQALGELEEEPDTTKGLVASYRRLPLAFIMVTFFTALAIALPHMAMTSAFISGRISIWTILVSGAMFEQGMISPSLILGLLFVRSGDVTERFLTWNKTFDQLRTDLRVVEEGSLLYQVTSMKSEPLEPEGWNPSIIHADCLLLLERNCFVNNLFSLPYQQPLQNSPEIKFDLRDLYNHGQKYGILSNREWITWHLGFMSPELQERSVYIFFVKSEQERPTKYLGDVVIDRPRYTIYQFR